MIPMPKLKPHHVLPIFVLAAAWLLWFNAVYSRITNCQNSTITTARSEYQSHTTKSMQYAGKNLVLGYFSGKFEIQLFNFFVRSLRATGSTADIVVIIHGFKPSEQAYTLAEVYNAVLLPVPDSLLENITWSRDGALFRFRAWNWYLQAHQQKYCHVLNADMDVYFQTDPFSCFFGHECDNNANVFHSFSENPALRIGTCRVHRNWYVNDCHAINGNQYFIEHSDKTRICSGFSIGTTSAYLIYLRTMEEYIFKTAGSCNDQPIHNILIWGNLLKDINTVYVWDYFTGPVKTIDVGYIMDDFGRVINENGLPYCVIHQFKADRNPYVKVLNGLFPLHTAKRRVHFEDTRFPVCDRKECKGLRVHSSVDLMIEQKIDGAWRGPLPTIVNVMNPEGVLPIRSPKNSGYKWLTKFNELNNTKT